MKDARSCIACGCALEEGTESCPVCGAPVESPSARKRSAHAADAALVGKRRLVVVALALAAVAVIVAVVLVAQMWLADEDLRERAADAEANASSAAVQPPVKTAGAVSIDAGNAAAGGIAVGNGEALYEASTDGVFYRTVDDEVDDVARRVASVAAYDLNVADDGVLFLSAAQGGRSSFEGDAVFSVSMAIEGDAGPKPPSSVYEPAKEGDMLSCLSVVGDACYFLERDGQSYSAIRYDADEGKRDELFQMTAARAWLFVERDVAYFVSTDDDGWSVRRAALDTAGVSFAEVSKGVGRLDAVALNGGKLYFATSSEKSDAHLQCSDLKGGVAEFADVVNPVRIAASGDVVAVMTRTGNLVWVDAVTGVSHDLTDKLNALVPNIVPTSAAMSVCGKWVCIADGKDDFCRISVSGEATVATV